MRWLELKVPPPVVAAVLAALAWLIARAFPGLALPLSESARFAATALLAAVGLSLDGYALFNFLRARTTINPMQPRNSSTLVERGPYRFTRNPMYLGLLLVLSGWTLWLDNALAFIVLPLFVAYITRFQILPEERSLADRFGASFAAYRARVRRWI